MKGIILAGGSGTRLYPITQTVCKQLLPVYDKPMIYYPLSVLMLTGIRDILIISTPQDLPRFEALLGDGTNLGMRFEYKVQEQPRGLADAFLVGKEFIGSEPVCLILGDNIFFGHDLPGLLGKAAEQEQGAAVFAYRVSDPERYGVVELDEQGVPVSIQEKPSEPRSNLAIAGLYYYGNEVVRYAEDLKPSARGELEITDINQRYLREKQLSVHVMGRGYAWLDTGTFGSLSDATNYVRTIEERQGLKISCIEEIAYRMKYINADQLKELARPLVNSGYGEYLLKLVED